MATTKTIQPTGETITIPAMADQPDMSVVATDLGNITDAVNAQNQALTNLSDHKAEFNTTIKDTRLPSSNQQIENILIGASRNIMYLGNSATIDDVLVQTKTGDLSINEVRNSIESGLISANATYQFSYDSSAFLVVTRGSYSKVVIFDQWSEFNVLHDDTSISISVSSKTVTVTNGRAGYVNYLVVKK